MTLTPNGYRPRLIDPKVDAALRTFGAVSIEGPKWCGKTWTAENHASSEFKLADSAGPISNSELARADFHVAMKGEEPHLIDEWQEAPSLWDRVRSDVDGDPRPGRYILTGSSVPRREEYIHSGAGRIGKVRMRTMSLLETGDSDGSVSLKGLFESPLEEKYRGEADLDRVIELIVRGGWPGMAGREGADPGLMASSYVEASVEDASRLDGRRRDEGKMRMLVRSLARNESTMAKDTRVMSDMKRFDDERISVETYRDYLDCLDRIHLIEETPSFRPDVRSDMRVGKAPKRHFADVSLAVAALGLGRKALKEDPETLGFMFEGLAEHDLAIYAESLGGRLFHYRDGRGREIDAVVELPDGRWGAFEVKLGSGQIDSAAKGLLRMKALFEGEGRPPSALCVVCGMAAYSYTRPDGVSVVPLTALGPRALWPATNQFIKDGDGRAIPWTYRTSRRRRLRLSAPSTSAPRRSPSASSPRRSRSSARPRPRSSAPSASCSAATPCAWPTRPSPPGPAAGTSRWLSAASASSCPWSGSCWGS